MKIKEERNIENIFFGEKTEQAVIICIEQGRRSAPHFQTIFQDFDKKSPEDITQSSDCWKFSKFFERQGFICSKMHPTLSHITSFGKNVMENHGKSLCEAYLDLLQVSKQFVLCRRMQDCQKIDKSEGDFCLEDTLNSFQVLKYETKSQLLYEATNNVEFKQLLIEIIKGIPKNVLEGPLSIALYIFKIYKDNIQCQLDEEEICNFVKENSKKFAQEMYSEFSQFFSRVTIEIFQIFADVWMESLFLGLHGIYTTDKRQRQIESYSEQSEWQLAMRKRIKLE